MAKQGNTPAGKNAFLIFWILSVAVPPVKLLVTCDITVSLYPNNHWDTNKNKIYNNFNKK